MVFQWQLIQLDHPWSVITLIWAHKESNWSLWKLEVLRGHILFTYQHVYEASEPNWPQSTDGRHKVIHVRPVKAEQFFFFLLFLDRVSFLLAGIRLLHQNVGSGIAMSEAVLPQYWAEFCHLVEEGRFIQKPNELSRTKRPILVLYFRINFSIAAVFVLFESTRFPRLTLLIYI